MTTGYDESDRPRRGNRRRYGQYPGEPPVKYSDEVVLSAMAKREAIRLQTLHRPPTEEEFSLLKLYDEVINGPREDV